MSDSGSSQETRSSIPLIGLHGSPMQPPGGGMGRSSMRFILWLISVLLAGFIGYKIGASRLDGTIAKKNDLVKSDEPIQVSTPPAPVTGQPMLPPPTQPTPATQLPENSPPPAPVSSPQNGVALDSQPGTVPPPTVVTSTPVDPQQPVSVPAVPIPEIPAIRSGTMDEKQIALTFDDGPHPRVTPKVLDILKSNQIHATFFVLGNMVQKAPKVLKRIVDEGHEIGNHTFSHRILKSMENDLIKKELDETQDLIQKAVGFRAQLFRPPYGSYREPTKLLMYDAGIRSIILWSVDPEDWKYRNKQTVFEHITSKAHEGAIVVCHDIYTTTMEALPDIIQDLKGKGYTFKTVSELCGLASTNLIHRVPETPIPVPVQTQPSAVPAPTVPAAPPSPGN